MLFEINFSRGRFGNKMYNLFYSLYFSNNLKDRVFFNPFGISRFFDVKNKYQIKIHKSFRVINNTNFLEDNHQKNLIFKGGVLGDYFFKTKYDLRKNLTIKKSFTNKNRLSKEHLNVAIHFRGTDFFSWDKKSILPFEYYLKAIKSINKQNVKFYLYTDDSELTSFKKVINYLKSNDLSYDIGRSKSHFILDFSEMANCDVLISTPSTFCIWAGILEKEKIIIQNKNWVNYRIENNDAFWKDCIFSNDSLNYKVDKLL